MKKLDGKRVVITGAASGLGRSLALVLARKGCRIGIADIDMEGAEETLDMVIQRGGSGETFEINVSKPEMVEAMAEHFFDAWGGVDLLVNNAGVVSAGFVGDVPLEDWEWIMGISFWGMLYGCHYFIPRFKTQGGGYILNVSSVGGLMCIMEMAPYNVAKAAVIALSETLKGELSPFKIGVTALCPTFFKTNLLDNMRVEDEWEANFSRTTFEHARMTSDQVAEAAVKAVERGKVYCVPQFTGKLWWMTKRFSPSIFYNLMALGNRLKIARPLGMLLARLGLM